MQLLLFNHLKGFFIAVILAAVELQQNYNDEASVDKWRPAVVRRITFGTIPKQEIWGDSLNRL